MKQPVHWMQVMAGRDGKPEPVFRGRTVLIIAHRLEHRQRRRPDHHPGSGRLVECGNHRALIQQRGAYFNLIRNQLELG